ncbi:MAG: GtrA family protein [Clostridiales bacterium]|nr:GtrA family protein [Clostridiales bacterium]
MLKFILVGVVNTLFGAGIMFLLQDMAHFGYWGSSAVANILGAVLSFFLNKSFTFQNKDSLKKTALRFALIIAGCYLIGYGLAKPLTYQVLSSTALSADHVEKLSLLVGMCLFTGLNYIGQRFFAFKEKEEA